MTTNTMKKVAEASNFNDPHTDTNGVNSPTDGATNQAPEGMAVLAPSLPPSPDKATILAALTKLIDPPDVFGFRSLPTKKRQHIHAITDLGLGDFLVYTNKKTVYCKDLEAVQAFAQKLGATK